MLCKKVVFRRHKDFESCGWRGHDRRTRQSKATLCLHLSRRLLVKCRARIASPRMPKRLCNADVAADFQAAATGA